MMRATRRAEDSEIPAPSVTLQEFIKSLRIEPAKPEARRG